MVLLDYFLQLAGAKPFSDFMNNGKFIPLDYKLTPIHESRIDNNIFMKFSSQTAVEGSIQFILTAHSRPPKQLFINEIGPYGLLCLSLLLFYVLLKN